MSVGAEAFSELLAEDLSGVTFVRDYLQLQFNSPPSLNAYTPVTVSCGGRSASSGEEAFANLLIGQINKVASSVDLRPEDALIIRFEDGSTIAVSLRPEDYVCPEAVNFYRKDDSTVVL